MLEVICEGPTRRPTARAWTLDGLLVGVGTLRVTRELFRRYNEGDVDVRAWDLSFWGGVTPTGAAGALERLERQGLVERVRPARGVDPTTWGLVPSHTFYAPLRDLFAAERHRGRGLEPPIRVVRRRTAERLSTP